MSLPLKDTLGEMRAELLSRIGFASQGARAGSIVKTVDSFLKRAQKYLYRKYPFYELNEVADWTMAAGQTLYDWPDDVDPRNVQKMRVLYSGVWQPMHEGIELSHDTVVDSRYFPTRCEKKAQLEVWPQPDGIYTVRCDHYRRLGRFTQDDDRCTIDDDLLFSYTLAKLKRHYRHPDAQDYLDESSDLLRQYRIAAHGDKRYIMGETSSAPIPEPKVLDYK